MSAAAHILCVSSQFLIPIQGYPCISSKKDHVVIYRFELLVRVQKKS
jgi:hypothetical protein